MQAFALSLVLVAVVIHKGVNGITTIPSDQVTYFLNVCDSDENLEVWEGFGGPGGSQGPFWGCRELWGPLGTEFWGLLHF